MKTLLRELCFPRGCSPLRLPRQRHDAPAPALPLCILFVLALALSACSGPRTGRVIGDGNVQYDDPAAAETVTADYGSTDLQMTAEHMTQSLLASTPLTRNDAPPRIRLREVKNYTDEHIDTQGITDKIRVKLLKSGNVRFLADTANMDQVFNERDFAEAHTSKGASSPMLESDYVVTGAVRSIRKQSDDLRDVFYQFTMELVDPQSGEILWADEKEIRKVTEKPFFGW